MVHAGNVTVRGALAASDALISGNLTGKHAESVLGDRMSHCGPDAEWRQPHDEAGELEHHLRKAFEEIEHRFSGLSLNAAESHTENDREDHDLQNVIARGGIRQALGRQVF